MGDEKLTDQMPRRWREKGGKEDRKLMGRCDCVKRDMERVGGEWGTTAKDKWCWRLLIETQ